MAAQPEKVDLTESSIYGPGQQEAEDSASEHDLDRLEAITGGADEPIVFDDEDLELEDEELEAETDEEIDALRVDLLQDEDVPARDGSGRVVDSVAEEQLAEFTEVGPASENRGGIAVTPGRDDTSSQIRRNRTRTGAVDSDAIVEGSLAEASQDETSE